MATVNTLQVRLVTGTGVGAGTDGFVYVGIGGREFCIDSPANDFQSGSDRTYTLGEGPNILNAVDNDPRNPAIDMADIPLFPTYVRFEPGGDWVVEEVQVTAQGGGQSATHHALAGSALKLRLSQTSGKVIYLK